MLEDNNKSRHLTSIHILAPSDPLTEWGLISYHKPMQAMCRSELTFIAFVTPSLPVPRVGLCKACASVPGMFFLMSWAVCTHQVMSRQQHVKAGILVSNHRQTRLQVANIHGPPGTELSHHS